MFNEFDDFFGPWNDEPDPSKPEGSEPEGSNGEPANDDADTHALPDGRAGRPLDSNADGEGFPKPSHTDDRDDGETPASADRRPPNDRHPKPSDRLGDPPDAWTVDALLTLHPERAGPFAHQLNAWMLKHRRPSELRRLVWFMREGAGQYPRLRLRYTSTPLGEVVREVRGILRRRWGGDGLTPSEVEGMLDESLLHAAVENLISRSNIS